jgi:serralysin
MSFHLYTINELYSNADGSVQFIEMAVGPFDGQSFWQGQTISVTQGSTSHSYTFPSDLPSDATANTTVLIATQGFANLGIVAPDFVVPSGFLFTSGGTVNYAGVDSVSYSSLPTDGTHSVDRNGIAEVNSPTDFAGVTGTVTVPSNMGQSYTGTAGDDILVGGAGNDTFTGGPGNDTIDGRAGIDMAIYGGTRGNFMITKTVTGFTVADNRCRGYGHAQQHRALAVLRRDGRHRQKRQRDQQFVQSDRRSELRGALRPVL